MKLGELLPLINGTDICIVAGNDYYYYENHRTKFIASVFNEKKMTENEILNTNLKTITNGANGIIICVEYSSYIKIKINGKFIDKKFDTIEDAVIYEEENYGVNDFDIYVYNVDGTYQHHKFSWDIYSNKC